MSTIGDLLTIFATCDIAKRRELETPLNDHVGFGLVSRHGRPPKATCSEHGCKRVGRAIYDGLCRKCADAKCALTPTRIPKRPVCTACREGRHEECAAIVVERDSTPEGEVREWEEACACDAPACAYDLGEYEQGREELAQEDAAEADDDDAYSV